MKMAFEEIGTNIDVTIDCLYKDLREMTEVCLIDFTIECFVRTVVSTASTLFEKIPNLHQINLVCDFGQKGGQNDAEMV